MLGSNVELMVFAEILKEKNLRVWKHFAWIGQGLQLVPQVKELTDITCVDLARTVLMTFTLEWFLKVFAISTKLQDQVGYIGLCWAILEHLTTNFETRWPQDRPPNLEPR